MSEVTATPFDEISQAVKAQHKELIEIRKSIDSLTRRLAPPSGDDKS